MSRSPSPAPGQQEIDFSKPAAQPRKQKMLDALRPECGCVRKINPETGKPGRGCSCAKRLKLILRALDTFQQRNNICWPSVKTISVRVGFNERTTQRLLRLAERLGFIKITPKNRSTSHYSIEWLKIWNVTEEGCKKGPPEGVNLPVEGCKKGANQGRKIYTQNSTCEFNTNSNMLNVEELSPENAKGQEFLGEGKKRWQFEIKPQDLIDTEWLIDSFSPRAASKGVQPGATALAAVCAARLSITKDNPGGYFWDMMYRPAVQWLHEDLIAEGRRILREYRELKHSAGVAT